MARTVTETLNDLRVNLKPLGGTKSVSYSNLVIDTEDEKVYEFAKGIMALQAVPGTMVSAKRDYILSE